MNLTEHAIRIGSMGDQDDLSDVWGNFLVVYCAKTNTGVESSLEFLHEDLKLIHHAEIKIDIEDTAWLVFDTLDDQLAFYLTYA